MSAVALALALFAALPGQQVGGATGSDPGAAPRASAVPATDLATEQTTGNDALDLAAHLPDEPGGRTATARWAVTPSASGAEAEVGEPLVLELLVEHPSGRPPELDLDPEAEFFPAPWVLLEELPTTTLPVADQALGLPGAAAAAGELQRMRTRFAWRVVRLVPGEASLPALSLSVAGEFARADPLDFQVRGVLGPNEDVPRPEAGFHEPARAPAEPLVSPLARATLFAVAGLVALVVGVRRLQRRKRELASAPPSAAVRLDGLAPELAAGGDAARSAHYTLTRLLREVVDGRTGRPLPSATDGEWLAALRASDALEPDELEACELVLQRAAEVKYGGREVTRWAADETLAAARSVLEAPGAGARTTRVRGAAEDAA